MEFFRKRRINKAVRATLAAAERDDELATSFIGGLEAGERADAWCQVVDAVMDDEGDEAVIRQAIERALEADPDHWGAWEAMASLEQSLEGRSGETMAAYEKLHALDAENSVVRLELAVLLMLAGRVE